MIAAERRRQILAAAAACFARRGFHAATMPDICAEAGLSPGTVYRYFRSKDDLIEALIEQDRADSLAMMEALAAAPAIRAAIRAGVAETLAGVRDAAKAAGYVEIGAEAARNPRVAAIVRRHEASVTGALAMLLWRAQQRGEVAADLDPRLAAEAIAALARGALSLPRAPREPAAECGPAAFLAGGRYVWGDPVIRALMFLLAALNVTAAGPLVVGGAVLATERLGGAAAGAPAAPGGAGSPCWRRPLPSASGWPTRRLAPRARRGVRRRRRIGRGGRLSRGGADRRLAGARRADPAGAGDEPGVLAAVALNPISYAVTGALLAIGATPLFLLAGGLILLTILVAASSRTVQDFA